MVHLPDSESDELLRLRRAVNASGEIILLTDPQGVITFVNPEFTRVYGYAAEEVVGRTTPRILKSGALPDERYERFWSDLVEHHAATLDVLNRTKDGRLVSIEGSANAVLNDEGKIIGFVAIQRDVTERRSAEEALRLAQFALDHAADAICFAQPDGRLVYVNDAASRLSGYTREELLTLTVFDLAVDPEHGDWQTALCELASVQQLAREASARRKDGTLVPVDVTLSRLVFTGREYYCAIARDITDRRQLEAELRQAQKMDAIGRLAGGIAHDFNNVLTAILGYGELLSRRVQHDPALAADVDEITRAGERASRLTRQLLALSRRQAMNPVVVDLNAILTDMESMLRRVLRADIQLRIVAADSPGCVRADAGQIEQVLLNLVVNARDAMPLGGTLSIGTRKVYLDEELARRHAGSRPGAYVSLIVQDTGHGMPPDVLAHLFEPFFTTKAPGMGTGLGLSTVYGIVTQSGGFISVDSQPGAGTTFCIHLPCVDPQPDGAATPGGAPVAEHEGDETILLVEDEAGIRDLVRKVLQRRGYTVVEAVDAMDAINLAAQNPDGVDLLLTDVVMPEMNGVELARRFARSHPGTKILCMSGYSVQTHVDRISEQVCFLQKPFTPDVLARAVRACLDGRAARLAGR